MFKNNLLCGKRISLNPFRVSDVEKVIGWQFDEYYARHLDAQPLKPKREEDIRKWMEDDS
ncbi:hypothetical protein [Bacillus sp. T33-2]|uniref:hypothetical protein n=1 Tax=Bacillus sp. T33-2 TaxID=2054168 RepID=UPI002155265D|nr:hypothetical protein [Bacillus sp. T33-2]